jgi:hypothetical protein
MILPEKPTDAIDGWRDMQKDPPQVGEEIIVEMRGCKLGTFFKKTMRSGEGSGGMIRWMPSQYFYDRYFKLLAR